MTEEHKKKISIGLKKAHKNGKHPGWSHINTNNKYMSRPEKTLLRLLKEYKIYEKYHIEYGFSVSKYFFDFAVLDLKCDIEIDGVQHIRTKSAQEHDKIRDEYAISEGWKVFRISVKELYNSTILVMDELVEFLNNLEKVHRTYDPLIILNQYRGDKRKYGSRNEYVKNRRIENEIKVEPIIKKLLESDIEFDKFGWVIKASEIIGITQQKVNKWMRRYMPDFYDGVCFKKKNNNKTTSYE